MSLSTLVIDYGKPYSPYMGGFINHLPMAQIALFKMGKDLDQIKSYSDYFIGKFDIDRVKEEYPVATTIEECLGKRDFYESCLVIMKNKIEEDGADKVIAYVLNTYPYGLSSGIFHTIIRVYYAAEGAKIDIALKEEVARALAYYITGYKEVRLFQGTIKSKDFKERLQELIRDPYISNITHKESSLGKKMKALYDDDKYLEMGFLINGEDDEKIRTLLELSIPLYDHYHSMVMLHFVTGLHALVGLKDYFDNFSLILDIMTAAVVTHLLALEQTELKEHDGSSTDITWNELIKKGSNSLDVHTIKYTYSCNQLYKYYKIPELKTSVMNKLMIRINE